VISGSAAVCFLKFNLFRTFGLAKHAKLMQVLYKHTLSKYYRLLLR